MTRDQAIALLLSRARHRQPHASAAAVTGAGQAIALYRLGVSTEGQLWSDLLSLGYGQERLGDLVLSAQLARQAWMAERVLTLLRAALRAGHISHGQMISRLVEAGWPVDGASALADLEEVAPHQTPKQ